MEEKEIIYHRLSRIDTEEIKNGRKRIAHQLPNV
jgi:hypothetical protein